MLRGILFLSDTNYSFDESEKVIHLVSTAGWEKVVGFVTDLVSLYSDDIDQELVPEKENKKVICKITCPSETTFEAICSEIERQIR